MSMTDDEIFEDEDENSLSNIRAMLQSYYGTEESGSVARPEDVTNLDSNIFDINKYKPKLLREDGLGDLIQKNIKIINEVKGLDTDMQKLVYENYSKFMSATKTIRTLQGNVGDMETQMSSLFTSMDKVDKYSSTIGSQLNTNRAKVEKLVSVQRLLKKLEFLFDLPSRLQSCINIEAYEQAIRYYNGSQIVLNEYPNVISFNTIMKEATTIIMNLKNDLITKLNKQDITESKLEQYIRLLLQLDYPSDQLYIRYLEWHSHCLHKFIRRYLPVEEETEEDKEIKEISGESDSESDALRDYQRTMASSNLVSYVTDLNTSFVDKYVSMVVTYNDIFKNNESAQTSLLESSQKLFSLFFDAIQNKLYSIEDYKCILQEQSIDSPLFKDIYDGLALLTASIQKIDSLVKELNAHKLYEGILQKVIKIQIAGSFEMLRDNTFEQFQKLQISSQNLSLFKPQPATVIPRSADINNEVSIQTTTETIPEPSSSTVSAAPSTVNVDSLFSMDFTDVAASPVPVSALPAATTVSPTAQTSSSSSLFASAPSLTSTVFNTPSASESSRSLLTSSVEASASTTPTAATSITTPNNASLTDTKESIDAESAPSMVSDILPDDDRIDTPSVTTPVVPLEPEKTIVSLGEEAAAQFEVNMITVIERLQPILEITLKFLPDNIIQYTNYYHTQCQQVLIWMFTLIMGYKNPSSILSLGNADMLLLGTNDLTKKKNKKYIFLSSSLVSTLPTLSEDFDYRSCLAMHAYMRYLSKKGIKNIISVLLDHTPTEVDITSDQLNRQIGYTCLTGYSQESSNNMIKQYSILLGEQLGHMFLDSVYTKDNEETLEREESSVSMENSISSVSLMIVRLLFTSFNDLLQIFTDINPVMSNPEFTSISMNTRRRDSSVSGMYSYIEKALSAKTRVYPYELKYNMKEIINCIVKCMLKYLLEASKDCYFTKNQYIYFMNNIVFISGMLKRISQDDEDYKGLLTDVIHMVGDRCYDIYSVEIDYNHQIDLCNEYANKI